jgi:hypothetical protein
MIVVERTVDCWFLLLTLQENKVTGRKADVMMAAHLAFEAALRLVKPGNEVSTASDWKSFTAQKLLKPNWLNTIHSLLQSTHSFSLFFFYSISCYLKGIDGDTNCGVVCFPELYGY